ncbi:hypothetical protein [Amycolatopsis panacis]|nr:hypothetical protein [Amycolatopsis panacis]
MAELAVDAAMVVPVDVFGDGDLDIADGLPAAAADDRIMNQLTL